MDGTDLSVRSSASALSFPIHTSYSLALFFSTVSPLHLLLLMHNPQAPSPPHPWPTSSTYHISPLPVPPSPLLPLRLGWRLSTSLPWMNLWDMTAMTELKLEREKESSPHHHAQGRWSLGWMGLAKRAWIGEVSASIVDIERGLWILTRNILQRVWHATRILDVSCSDSACQLWRV
jgi:hypothetical protein